ncbi:hypothetical protein OGAPHI_000632 [Ogataea philodendri]|uniref:peptidyl-tRNA hydrolase n=1 Tax=Ogataea philodendri TaxID=1378263 RepID=A0A9P8T9J1_9ASCO|nr:uncharacterized protein OGAPHI_000632 [Ogataea philodendri]KAH3670921.1 hypothetical protein OGAPHI_000632 [Ogataea philodendri]
MLNLLQFVRSSSTVSRIASANDKPVLIMVASIGNPEAQYHGTRHSVGHLVIQKLSQDSGYSQIKTIDKYKFKTNPDYPDVLLYQNPGFMNTSGKNLLKPWKSVVALSQWNPVLVILHDELDIDLGKIRVRKQNSSPRGHNGLKSIQQHIGKGYNAVQIGIGRDPSGNKDSNTVANYVLGKFSAEETQRLDDDVVPKIAALIQEMRQGKHIFDTL